MKDTPFIVIPADQVVIGTVRKNIEKEDIREWIDTPIGYLVHKPTHTMIAVFHKINVWQRWWIKFCFGLKYEEL